MFHNLKFKLWDRINTFWLRFKPECRHWWKVVSSAKDGRREIEVSECRWCKANTSELYVKGKSYDEHFDKIEGYGPVEACPVTQDPEPGPAVNSAPVITLKNKELYFERHNNVVEANRDSRTRKKTTRKSR